MVDLFHWIRSGGIRYWNDTIIIGSSVRTSSVHEARNY